MALDAGRGFDEVDQDDAQAIDAVIEHGAAERDFEDAEDRHTVERHEALVDVGSEANEARVEDVQEQKQDDGNAADAVEQPGPVALAAAVTQQCRSSQ